MFPSLSPGRPPHPAAAAAKLGPGDPFCRAALAEFAKQHDGRFPEKNDLATIGSSLWEMPGTNGMRYRYVGGLSIADSSKIHAYEPEFFGGKRLALTADGNIRSLTTEEIRRELPQEKKP